MSLLFGLGIMFGNIFRLIADNSLEIFIVTIIFLIGILVRSIKRKNYKPFWKYLRGLAIIYLIIFSLYSMAICSTSKDYSNEVNSCNEDNFSNLSYFNLSSYTQVFFEFENETLNKTVTIFVRSDCPIYVSVINKISYLIFEKNSYYPSSCSYGETYSKVKTIANENNRVLISNPNSENITYQVYYEISP